MKQLAGVLGAAGLIWLAVIAPAAIAGGGLGAGGLQGFPPATPVNGSAITPSSVVTSSDTVGFVDAGTVVCGVLDAGTAYIAGQLQTAGAIKGGTNIDSVSGYLCGGSTCMLQSFVQTGDTALRGNITNGAASIAVKFANNPLLTAGKDRSIAGFYNDNGSTLKSQVTSDGTYVGSVSMTTVVGWSVTAPTISSGFGSSPSIVASNGTMAFEVNVGTGGAATSGVIGLPTATTGWNCYCTDITTNSSTVFVTKQTASATTTCTVGNFNTSAAAAAWVGSDKLRCTAMAY